MADLTSRIRTLDERRRALLDELDALDAGRIATRPAAGGWSILEIVEHMVLAERDVFRGMPDAPPPPARPRALRHRFGRLAVMFVLTRRIRVRAPSRAMLPTGTHDLAALRALWDANHHWLDAHVAGMDATARRAAPFRHPITGPLTADQAVDIALAHLARHTGQIRKRLEG